MNKLIALLLFAVSAPFVSNSQQLHRCYTDQKLDHIKQHNPEEYNSIVKTRKQVIQQAQFYQNTSAKIAQYRIPVVFHVLHAGEPIGTGSNLDSMQLLSQLKILNEDFNRLNADSTLTPSIFKPIAGSLDIEFVMAQLDPNGNPTSAITRHNYGQLSNTNTIDNQVKPVTIWDANNYFNIWIADMDNNILGYATLPGSNQNRDGIVLDYRYVGSIFENNFPSASPYNRGRTCTHEVGHYLGLLHTFQGGCSGTNSNSCNFQGDDICDTPPTSGPNYGCNNTTNQNSCNELPSDNPDMPMNFMDYANDACMNIFTEGQAAVMESSLSIARSSLLSSPAILDQFTLDGQIVDENGNGVADAKVIFIASDFEIELQADASGFFSSSNFSASSYNIYAGKWGFMTNEYATNYSIDENTPSLVIPIESGVYYDDFTMDFNWDITGIASGGIWERGVPKPATYNGQFTQPDFDVSTDFGMKCYLTGNSAGIAEIDDVEGGNTVLSSPVFDLTGMNEPVLSYERWFFNGGGTTTPNDKLIVRITNGLDNVILEEVDHNELNANQWKSKSFNLKDFVALTSTMRIYIDVSDFATAPHLVDGGLDQFKIEDSNPTSIKDIEIRKLRIYPNPSKAFVNIDLRDIRSVRSIQLLSLSGRAVFSSENVANQIFPVDVSDLSSGIYFVRVLSEDAVYQERLVVSN